MIYAGSLFSSNEISENQGLTTYLLDGMTLGDISVLHGEAPKFFQANPRTGHGIFVSAARPNGGGQYRVARVLPGDNSDIVLSWIESRTIDGLVEAFEKSPPTSQAKEEAYARWESVRAQREELEKRVADLKNARIQAKEDLDKACDAESEASLEMVRTHGRAVVWVNGHRWEPVVSRDEKVYYRRKR